MPDKDPQTDEHKLTVARYVPRFPEPRHHIRDKVCSIGKIISTLQPFLEMRKTSTDSACFPYSVFLTEPSDCRMLCDRVKRDKFLYETFIKTLQHPHLKKKDNSAGSGSACPTNAAKDTSKDNATSPTPPPPASAVNTINLCYGEFGLWNTAGVRLSYRRRQGDKASASPSTPPCQQMDAIMIEMQNYAYAFKLAKRIKRWLRKSANDASSRGAGSSACAGGRGSKCENPCRSRAFLNPRYNVPKLRWYSDFPDEKGAPRLITNDGVDDERSSIYVYDMYRYRHIWYRFWDCEELFGAAFIDALLAELNLQCGVDVVQILQHENVPDGPLIELVFSCARKRNEVFNRWMRRFVKAYNAQAASSAPSAKIVIPEAPADTIAAAPSTSAAAAPSTSAATAPATSITVSAMGAVVGASSASTSTAGQCAGGALCTHDQQQTLPHRRAKQTDDHRHCHRRHRHHHHHHHRHDDDVNNKNQ